MCCYDTHSHIYLCRHRYRDDIPEWAATFLGIKKTGEARSLARVKALELLYHGNEGVKSFSAVGLERAREEGREEGVVKVLAEALLERMEREA